MRFKTSDAIAALGVFVTVALAVITVLQLGPLRRQAQTAETQARPYLRYTPKFRTIGPSQIEVELLTENLSSVPGHLIYSDAKIYVDGQTNSIHAFNRSGDNLYEHKNGFSVLLPMPETLARALTRGTAKLEIGTCAVYRSLEIVDRRRWQIEAIYSYQADSDFPMVLYSQDSATDSTVKSCDASSIRAKWMPQQTLDWSG